MNNITIYESGRTYKRINRTAAKNEYLNGKTVYIIPCNIRLINYYITPYTLNKNTAPEFITTAAPGTVEFFNKFMNQFEFYNCTCAETGRRAAFYIEIDNTPAADKMHEKNTRNGYSATAIYE